MRVNSSFVSYMRDLLLVLACFWAPALAIDAKCSACNAVTMELLMRLDAETPRNHLDMRHRLDKDGKRYGKLIEYKVSELRMEELLDGLCKELEAYEYHHPAEDGEEGSWSREKADRTGAEAARYKQLTVDLVNHCHRLLEQREDAVVGAIRQGADAEVLKGAMCGSVCVISNAPPHCEL